MTLRPPSVRDGAYRRRGAVPIVLALAPAAMMPITIVVGALDVSLSGTTVLKRAERPSSGTSPDGSRHYPGLLERRGLNFGRVVKHEVYTGRYPSLSYGHVVDIRSRGQEAAGAEGRRLGPPRGVGPPHHGTMTVRPGPLLHLRALKTATVNGGPPGTLVREHRQGWRRGRT